MIRGLVELCNLAKDESVLIHPVAGADGVAAIQIARMLETKVGYF
jgi:NADPH:quinone reductase-like Zn-dependent oxidoreductase